jgi:hypothetical protein
VYANIAHKTYSEVQDVFEFPGGIRHHKCPNTYCTSLYKTRRSVTPVKDSHACHRRFAANMKSMSARNLAVAPVLQDQQTTGTAYSDPLRFEARGTSKSRLLLNGVNSRCCTM